MKKLQMKAMLKWHGELSKREDRCRNMMESAIAKCNGGEEDKWFDKMSENSEERRDVEKELLKMAK
jgi:hypothetical protein